MSTIPNALRQLFPNADPSRDYEVRDDGDGPFIAAWRLSDPQPTEAAIQAAAAAYDTADAAKKSDAAALRTGILAQANAAVGVAYASVTAPMVKALVWILLWKIGALNKDLTVKPLTDWVRDP